MIEFGRGAPWFIARSRQNPRYNFSSLGGRWLVMGFMPRDPQRRAQMIAVLDAMRPSLSSDGLVALAVTGEREVFSAAEDDDALRWFLDDGAIAAGYGALSADGTESGRWVLIDPSLRVVDWFDGPGAEPRLLDRLSLLPSPDAHAGTPLNAPVLILPRVFEPELCRRLIAHYETEGGEISGTMREIDGRTVGVVDGFKRRRDAYVNDDAFRLELRRRLERRVLPQIHRAFQFEVTRLERYVVARYDAEEGGWFRPHRDNTTSGTAHRKFACSINLNAEEYEGGDLRFPEYGSRTYRPPTGGAVVFSCSLLHEATPVTRGTRYAFLPFFFDEAGETLRQANLHTLDLTKAQARA